jgi:hypothetical protein
VVKKSRNVKCLDERDVWQRLRDAAAQERGTTLSRKDVEAVVQRLNEQVQATPIKNNDNDDEVW